MRDYFDRNEPFDTKKIISTLGKIALTVGAGYVVFNAFKNGSEYLIDSNIDLKKIDKASLFLFNEEDKKNKEINSKIRYIDNNIFSLDKHKSESALMMMCSTYEKLLRIIVENNPELKVSLKYKSIMGYSKELRRIKLFDRNDYERSKYFSELRNMCFHGDDITDKKIIKENHSFFTYFTKKFKNYYK